MRKRKNVVVAVVLIMVLALSGCTNLGDSIADAISKDDGNSSNSEKNEKEEKKDDDNSLGNVLGNLFGNDSDKNDSSSGNGSNSLESLFGDLIQGNEGLEGIGGNGNSSSGNSGDMSYDDMMNALSQLSGEEDADVWKTHFKFPKCTSWSEWPSADTWKAMGMIDIQPKGCDFAKVQDDGQYLIDGIWNGFFVECQCDDGELQRISQQLWDAGYRGVPVGDGAIAEADSIDDVLEISEYSKNEYLAFYEFNGYILCVNVELHTWDNSIEVGIYDALTMTNSYENLVKNPSVDKSKAKEGFPTGTEIELIGSDFTGKWGKYNEGTEANPYMTEHYYMYSRNVTKAQWDKYYEGLQSLSGVYCDGYDEDGWEGAWLYYDNANSNGFGCAYIGYCEKAGLMYYAFEKTDY